MGLGGHSQGGPEGGDVLRQPDGHGGARHPVQVQGGLLSLRRGRSVARLPMLSPSASLLESRPVLWDLCTRDGLPCCLVRGLFGCVSSTTENCRRCPRRW